jgi:outer membrane receptor for ferrienterochelin and colicins
MTKILLPLVMLFSICTMAQVKNDTLKKETEELEEVRVQSTRTTRTIRNTPTRIETIDAEELEEKSNMKPANVSMVLHESTGLQVQQTSATSGNASIRVQGLDGRYTQLLKDGYPNFGNFASGLSILEIPPLDLKQVEVIKGPASTLFGGGAIAGVVNFISKTPKEKAEFNFIINQSNIGQSNIGGYASQRKGKFGYAILGLFNLQKSYDVDNDDFSEIPKSNNFTINPRIFYYPNPTTTFMLGNSFTKGIMKGGDMNVIAGNADNFHKYFEQNQTIRNTTTFEFDKKFTVNNSFKLKQSWSFFDRNINIPNYEFAGFNTNIFTDASYLWTTKKQTIITGLNFQYDDFKQQNISTLDAKSNTIGAYIQQTWDISDDIKLENGLRVDNVNYSNPNFSKSQVFVLPKISALFKFNAKWSSRIGGGLGYKIPTIFTEQTETNQYQNVFALNNVEAEKSFGGTSDVNFKTNFSDDFVFSINQMFFATQINKPLILQNSGINTFFINADKPVISKGFETNVKFIFKEDLKFFVGYTFTDAKAKYLTTNQFLPLLPKNKLNMALIFEKENNFKLGLEGFFTDKQFLYNGTKTPTFWEFGFMAEKTLWKNYSFFINFENFTDTRQSNYKPVVSGSHSNPIFDDIWTHTEGATINGGIKLKF